MAAWSSIVVIAPMMYLDRVAVNQDGFYSHRGFWWNPTVHQIRYDELSEVRLVVDEKPTQMSVRAHIGMAFAFEGPS